MPKISLRSLQRKLFLFGIFKIPLIGFCRPRIVSIDDDSIAIRIPFRRRTRNHVGSMYLGVLTIGADLASGFLAFYLVENQGYKTSPVFAGMKAVYHKRAEGDVTFVCEDGAEMKSMIERAKESGERVTSPVQVKAICLDEVVAEFEMEISFRLK